MENVQIFLWAVLGSVLMDLLSIEEEYRPVKGFPKRYRDVSFLALRFAIALAAGAIAVAQHVNTPILALQVGASAPLIIRRLARGIQGAPEKELPKVQPKQAGAAIPDVPPTRAEHLEKN